MPWVFPRLQLLGRNPGADPGFSRGGFVHSEGGVSYRNFRSGSKLLQGPGQINKQKKIADSHGGGSDHPKKNPVSAHETTVGPTISTFSVIWKFIPSCFGQSEISQSE